MCKHAVMQHAEIGPETTDHADVTLHVLLLWENPLQAQVMGISTLTNACHHDILNILAGCEAGLHPEKATGNGKKPHTAGPALERDDSAMEEAWVCSLPSFFSRV